MDQSLYDQVGADFFTSLVNAFYARVASDEVLRPMYPADLTESRGHLTAFLIQYWGGPTRYQEERGHPRLRLRHAPFAITADARDAWLSAMTGALGDVRGEVTDEQYAELRGYFEMAAHQLRNV
ncbi:MAG: globin [Acidobacteriota bacterium]|nr:globin [Acidobacteriota bacterium]